MVDFTKLMALSEAASGFNGGSYVDEMPNYTLDEAICGLPMMIMENQIAMYDEVSDHNEAIIEAVVTSIQTGDNSAIESINEGAIKWIIEKARAAFEKIKKFLMSIIVKIKAFFISRKKKGEEIFKKYADKIDPAKCKDKTFKGYKFDNDPGKVSSKTINSIINSMPKYSVFRDGFKNTKNTAADKIKEISETSRSERQRDFATAYTGVKLSSPDNWVDELRTHYYGATTKQGDAGKIDMKFGEGCFTVERIKQMLINNDGLKDLLEGYNKLLEDVNKNLDAVESAKKTIGDEDTDKNANMSAYCQAYLDLYTDAQNACSSVHAIIKQYYDSQWTQATQMLMTIVGTKKKEEEKPEEKKEEGKPAPTKEEKKEEK